MTFLSNRKHRIAAAVTAAAIAIGGGSAAVVAATSTASAGAAQLSSVSAAAPGHTAGPATKAGRHHRRDLLARTDHATIELRAKGKWVTLDLDRGTVTSVSSSAITLHRADGQSVTLQIASTTHFGGVASESKVRTGARATVISEDGTARRVHQRANAPATTPASTTATSGTSA